MLLLTRVDVFTPFAIFRRFCWPVWRRQAAQLRLGVPMGLSYLIEVTSYTFMALFIARFGTTTLAGHQIAGNIGAVLYMTPLSIGIASSTLVAQALGAHRPEAARTLSRHGIMMAVAIACCYGVIVLALRPYVIEGYTPNAQVVAAAMPLVLIVVCYHAFDALQITTAFVLRAYKVAVVPTVIYAVRAVGRGPRRRLSARLQCERHDPAVVDRRTRLLGGQYRQSRDCRHRPAALLASGEQAARARGRGVAGGCWGLMVEVAGGRTAVRLVESADCFYVRPPYRARAGRA